MKTYPNLDKNIHCSATWTVLPHVKPNGSEQTEQVEAIALQWHSVVQVIEKFVLIW